MTNHYREAEPGPALGLPVALLFMCAAAGLIAVAVFWPDKKPSEPQWLGMEVESLTADVRAALGLHPDQRGVYVSDVVGVAADAGVGEGDVIVSVDRRPITGLDSYRQAAQASRGKSSVRLSVVRRGAPLAIVVGSRPAQPGAVGGAGTQVGLQHPAAHGYVLGPNGTYYPQAAFSRVALPPGCATCPNAAACLPPGGATPAALAPGCATCPNAAACLPPGGATPAALPPGCATCPNAAACLPPGGATPAAFTRGCTTGTCPIR